MSNSVSGYFMKKKNPTAIKPEGGGVGLNGPAFKNVIFLRLPLKSLEIEEKRGKIIYNTHLHN